MQIEMMPVDGLIPSIHNSQTNPADQFARITASIVAFGFAKPPLPTGEDGVIIAGHGRPLASKHLGRAEGAGDPLDHLADARISRAAAARTGGGTAQD